jgi:hypothetical protein
VQIFTNYAGLNGLDGTTYGSLFFGNSSTWLSQNPPSAAPYGTDTYHPGEWNHAFTMNNGGTGGLYGIGATQTVVNVSSDHGPVAQSYSPTTGGSIVMSNVNGNPISYPNNPNPGYYFRQGQAVQFDPNGGTQRQRSSTEGSGRSTSRTG